MTRHDGVVRVLVVEDERLLADTVAAGLRRHAMAVDVAYDGDAALRRLAVNDYDVVVLDRDLPVTSGDEVCTTLGVEAGAEVRILGLGGGAIVNHQACGGRRAVAAFVRGGFTFLNLSPAGDGAAQRERLAEEVLPLLHAQVEDAARS